MSKATIFSFGQNSFLRLAISRLTVAFTRWLSSRKEFEFRLVKKTTFDMIKQPVDAISPEVFRVRGATYAMVTNMITFAGFSSPDVCAPPPAANVRSSPSRTTMIVRSNSMTDRIRDIACDSQGRAACLISEVSIRYRQRLVLPRSRCASV